MKLWLDDVREMPKSYDVWAKTSDEAIRLIQTGKIDHISYDYDLGGEDSGYKVALYIEEYEASHKDFLHITYDVHSANPVGVDRLLSVFNSIARIRRDKVRASVNNQTRE